MLICLKREQEISGERRVQSEELNKVPELLLEKHIYKIAGNEFVMHHDYTWDEYDWLDGFLRLIKNRGNILVSDNISKQDAVKFMSIVLRYKDGSTASGFNFGAATKSETLQIITDFFLTYALLKISIDKFLQLSEKEKEELLMSLMT
jgi:hypothetical protein